MSRAVVMRKKDRKWLDEIRVCTDQHGGMYPGLLCERVPHSVAGRLGAFIETYIPHNPIHKERWIITEAGRRALEQVPA